MAQIEIGLKAMAVAAAQERRAREAAAWENFDCRLAKTTARKVEELLGITVEPTGYPVEVDGLIFKVDKVNYEDDPGLFLVELCENCGEEAAVRQVRNLADLGDYLLGREKPVFCRSCALESACELETGPVTIRLKNALRDLLRMEV